MKRGSAEPSTEETTYCVSAAGSGAAALLIFLTAVAAGSQEVGKQGWGRGHKWVEGVRRSRVPAVRRALPRVSPRAPHPCVRAAALSSRGWGREGSGGLRCSPGEFPGARGALQALPPPLALSYVPTPSSCPVPEVGCGGLEGRRRRFWIPTKGGTGGLNRW